MQKELDQIKEYTYNILQNDTTGHSMDHIERVVAISQAILETEPTADAFVVLAAAYLHDTIDDKLVEDEAQAVEDLRGFLDSLAIEPATCQEIMYIIQHLSFSKEITAGKETLSLSGQIVQDADRIDALGAVGILRTAYFGGAKGHPIYDPAIKPIDYTSKKDYRRGSTVINHFYEKLFLLPDRMNTTYGKQEALRRKTFMENFLEEFYQEWPDTD
ncbi:metal-dependent phosphohydrolase [Enterococcus sp. JM4C]|uniref:HD domain-containing protein n=1 Tax=Candidatus Enterococcus huntleyi TaxID=1857217 RepID=UPI001379D4C3|nr:HD domain-containing protein [Enterococcus sp. JM4C]KAF1296042.1 metal-dependent phosphohydrolase [Enterococcus sp. JM4C]